MGSDILLPSCHIRFMFKTTVALNDLVYHTEGASTQNEMTPNICFLEKCSLGVGPA